MNSEDEKARKRRAEELRATIRDAGAGAKPDHAPTPREITDEAARKARDEAEGITPGKDKASK
jgi:hypothetical protein